MAKRRGAAGALLKLFILLFTYCLIVIFVLPTRWFIGEKYIKPVIGNYTPSPDELEILQTMDQALYTFIWAGFFMLLIAMAVAVYRETTEGQIYRSR